MICPPDPLSPSSVPVPSPTMTGVEGDVPTETTVREPRPGNRSPTLQEVPTEPEPAPTSPGAASVAETEAGDVRTDPTLNISPQFNPQMPPPPKAGVRVAAKPGFPKPPVTNLVLAPRSDEPPRGGAPGQPPPNRTGPKDRSKGTGAAAALQAVQSSQDKAQQIAQQRGQDLGSASAAAPAPPSAAQAQAAATQAAIDAQKKRIEDLRAQQNAQLQQEMQTGKAPGSPAAIGAIGAASGSRPSGTRTPTGNPTTPGGGRRQSSRSPDRGSRRRDRDRGRSGSRHGG